MIQIDMPMPDNCVECRFNVSEFGYCNAMPVEFCRRVNDYEEDGRPEWCPLKAQEPREMSDAELMDAIRKAPIMLKPAVDAAPVIHGRWVKMTGMMPPEYHGHYECSECRWHMRGLRNSWTREEELNYCPNCGTKMDGERRESDEQE